ncbi:MAG: insulinase family protein, partial [bacterium]
MTRTPFMPRGPVLTVAAAALLLLSSFTCFLSPAAAFVDRGEVLSRTLPSGMEVLVREEPAQKVVELQVWVGVGSRDEPAGREGIAHLFEHMLFKGTVKRGVGEIARTVEASGGDINAYTSMDHTVYHITIAREFFQTAVDILADAVLNSTFDAEELEKEKLVVIEEIHRGRDNPSRVFNEELFKAAFTVHPYGRTVIGTPESVSSVTRQDMVDFHRAWYVPGNMKLVAVGGVGADQVFEAAGRLFDVPAAEGAVRTVVREPEQGSMRSFSVVLDSEPARLALAFPIGSLTDPETPVLDLAAAILGSGGSSRLTARLRDSGLVHSAWSYAYTPVDPGIFVLGATTAQERVPQALEGLLREVARLQSEPVSEQELDRARDQILSDKIFSKETVEGQAREIGYVALTLGDLDFNDKYYSRLQSVEPSDILEVARRVFRPERATVGFLAKGPEFTPDEEKVNALLEGTLMSGRKAEKGEGEAVYRSVLPNGVTLLVREDHRLPIVAARVGFLGGSRYETADSQGIFNLLAHLLTRGTRKRTALEMAETLDGMSASLGGFSGRNSFGVTGVFLSNDASEGFSLMREVLTESTFPEEEVALFRER